MHYSPALGPTVATGAASTGVRVRGARVLHVFPSFGLGGVPLRMVRVINHFGDSLRHTVIALDNDFSAADGFAAEVDVELVSAGPALGLPGNALALRRLRPGLLVTYNWGAIEWAMADRLLRISPQLHFEAGFGKEEADTQIWRRVLFRRWALRRCAKVVVPSRRLEKLALQIWKLPASQVLYLPNGVNLGRFSAIAGAAEPAACDHPAELVVGTVAPLRPEKNVGRLLRAFAGLDASPAARLVVAGEGAERTALERLAEELGLSGRVEFTGRVAPEAVLGRFDVFALSSDTEQMPNALLEAMAAGRAVAAVDVGDVKSIVSEDNREFIVPRDDGPAFSRAIGRLLREPATRALLGRKNRERAAALFSETRMFMAYSSVFGIAEGAVGELVSL